MQTPSRNRATRFVPTHLYKFLILLGVIFAATTFAFANAQAPPHPGGSVLKRENQAREDSKELLVPGEWKLDDPERVVKQFQFVPKTAYSIVLEIRKPPDPMWTLELRQRIKKEIPAGSKLRFEASTFTNNKTRCQVTVESTKAPYDRIYANEFVLTKTLDDDPKIFTFYVSKTMPADKYCVRIGLNNARGSIQFATLSLVDEGLDSDHIKAQNAAKGVISPGLIERRINRYRKGDLKIAVVDRSGKAIPDAQVTVEQTSHKFLFGASLHDFHPEDNSPAQQNFQKRFLQIFNYATIPFIWKDMEPQKGKINYQYQKQLVDWCKAHQITPKGGPLVWDWYCPDWLPHDLAGLNRSLRSHIGETIIHFSEDIKAWDVVKETSDEWTVLPNAFGQWLKQAGPLPVTQKMLELASVIDRDPARTLLYIDWESKRQREVLKTLELSGNLPDAIGLETRFYKAQFELFDVWKLCEMYKKYEKPLHFSQVTVLSGPLRANPPFDGTAKDWLSTARGETEQADYVERFYSILFSHPSVQSITWWDLSDHDAFMMSPGGLLRKDGTPKPAFERLRKLIRERWWTRANLKTDTSGNCSTRAFWGNYDVTVTRGNAPPTKATFKFSDEQQTLKVVVN